MVPEGQVAASVRTGAHEHRLASMVRDSGALMAALETARELGLAEWCIGAGAVRGLVWDQLYGRTEDVLHGDLDLVYFDPVACSREAELALQHRLRNVMPEHDWEVVNQARVHQWMGYPQPFCSVAEGIASWPESATCVGVRLSADGVVQVIAPHGLDDLFAMRLRWNPARASEAVFQQRVRSKRLLERWPLVQVV